VNVKVIKKQVAFVYMIELSYEELLVLKRVIGTTDNTKLKERGLTDEECEVNYENYKVLRDALE